VKEAKKSSHEVPALEGSVTSKVARMSAGPPRMMSMRVPKAGTKEETKLELPSPTSASSNQRPSTLKPRQPTALSMKNSEKQVEAEKTPKGLAGSTKQSKDLSKPQIAPLGNRDGPSRRN
jgi:hypothetical protein